MTASLTIVAAPCAECSMVLSCTVVRCPKCRELRYLDHWEVYDDFAVCPANDCIVEAYESVAGNHLICRLVASAIAREESIAKPKRKRATKQKPERNHNP